MNQIEPDNNNNEKNISIESDNNQIESEQNNKKAQNMISDNNIDNIDKNNSIINNNMIEENIQVIKDNNNITNDNNINNNNIIDNSNIRNINDIINNDSIDILEIEEESKPYNPVFTFCFKLFFILNILAYIQSYSKSFEIKKYTLTIWPIINKNQYYRAVTGYFYHFTFFDLLISMIGLFLTTKYLEREIGSIYTILIIFYGIISNSILYLTIMWIFRIVLRYYEYNIVYQCGFTSIDFCLYLSYFLLKKNYNRNINFSFIDLRGATSVYYVIIIFQLITPSPSLIFNICGASGAFLIFGIIKYFGLPRNYWINDMEKFFRLNKTKNCGFKNFLGYFSINENENISNNVKEFDYFFDKINNKNEIIDNNIDIDKTTISRNNDSHRDNTNNNI